MVAVKTELTSDEPNVEEVLMSNLTVATQGSNVLRLIVTMVGKPALDEIMSIAKKEFFTHSEWQPQLCGLLSVLPIISC